MEVEIGVIGGSGFYSLIEQARRIRQETKYGMPSDEITIGKVSGTEIAFIPRHGSGHSIPPHKVPYRANIEALSSLGIKRIIATSAVGSLKKEYRPGDLAIFDQFVNMTHGRDDTFYDEDVVAHVSTAYPYCDELRAVASRVAAKQKLRFHEHGTVVVINGPRFSTKAESKFFSAQGFDMVNMTQYPEAALAREKETCYIGIGMVTDYDAGLEGTGIKPVTADKVFSIFEGNIEKTKRLVLELIGSMPKERGCSCSKSMDGAVHTKSR